MKPEVFAKIVAARAWHRRALAALPNVLGTAIGYKRRDGVKTRKSALIVYVGKKSPKKSLGAEALIPASIYFDRRKIATDVFTLGKLEYQFGPSPWYCRDRKDNQGTVTSLCLKRSSREPLALTCAHCIEGDDHNPSTPSVITLWDSLQEEYLSIGVSGEFVNSNGSDRVGFSDWGVFSINDQELADRAMQAKPMPIGAKTLGTAVQATTSHGVIYGSIEHLDIQFPNLVADLAIIINDHEFVFPGDSGLLWRDMKGGAVAIHAIGESWRGGSPISYCMFAERISRELTSAGIDMLDV